MKVGQKKIRLVAINILLLFFTLNLYSSNTDLKNYNRNQYKAEHKNWSISQDNYGVLYVGNDGGLLEYDGVRWESHKLPKNEVVRAVLALSNDKIYTGGFEEFGRWDRGIDGQLTYTSLSDSLKIDSFHNDDIWRICQLGDDICFQSFRSIYIYNPKSDKKIQTLSSKRVFFLNRVYEELWVQEIGGAIYKVEDGNYKKVKGSEIFANTNVQVILPYEDGQYLIGTSSKGIYKYDGIQFTEWYTDPNFVNDVPNCGTKIRNGNYYFGTIRNGIYVLSPSGKLINHINTESHLQNNTVLSIYTDSGNNVWVGLDKGITCLRPEEGMDYYIDKSNKIGAVYTAATYANKLFVGTNQGVYYMNLNEVNTISDISQFKYLPNTQGQVWDLTVVDNKLYCGHNNGLKVITSDLGVSTPYPVNTGVFSIVSDQKGRLLLGTYISLMIVDTKQNKLTSYQEINEPIRKIVLDEFDNVWLEHMNKGVYKCRLNNDRTHIESYTYFGQDESNTLPYNIRMFKVGARVAFLGNNTFYTYDDNSDQIVPYQPINEGVRDKINIKNAINIDKNNFWLIGENVVYKMSYNGSESKMEAMVDVSANNMGLINGFENIVSLNDSTSFICLDNGFLLYKNDSQTDAIRFHQPYIKSIAIKNMHNSVRYISYEQPMRIPEAYNTIEIAFASEDAFEYDLLFQYKIEELSGWSEPSKINSLLYERLPKGEYTLLIRSVDKLGNTSGSIACHFKILPPWHQTIWAYISYILVALGLTFGIWKAIQIRYKNIYSAKERMNEMKRLKDDKELLEGLVESKTAELLTQTSSIIQRNELIHKIKSEIDIFYEKGNKKLLAPLHQKLNVLLNNSIDSDEDWKTFLIKFEEKHANFFKYLRTSYPELTANDLKLCACLKLNLDSKEIASMMNISIRSVENNRYRLRKKLKIASDQNLNDFLFGLENN